MALQGLRCTAEWKNMIYKHFRFQVVLRVLLLIANLLAIAWLFTQTEQLAWLFILVPIAVLQTISLVIYVEATNKRLAAFFKSIKNDDFTTVPSEQMFGKSFDDLSHEFNQIIQEIKINRTEKEEHLNYLLTVVQHISIGIIVFRRDGKVDVFNHAIKRLLHVDHLRHIQDLEKVQADLPELLIRLKAGDKSLIKIFIDDELIQLSVNATEFKMRGETYVLVSLQNIHPELEEKEIESWQRLIRVLTHEIMNSITPISSLASTVQEMLINPKTDKIDIERLDDDALLNIRSAMATIESRSKGLINFVEIYRNLTRIPKPNFRHFQVQELFDRAFELLKPKFEAQNIHFGCRVFPDDLMVLADPDLIDQVVINLLLNSIDAVQKTSFPQISVIASTGINNRITIDFVDNGQGIKPDLMDKIFMPFFTSKQDGSGIGLSLSRQIMQMHKGAISFKSKPGEGTVFTLTF